MDKVPDNAPGQIATPTSGTACTSVSAKSECCAGLTAILLVIGIMDVRAMAVVAAAISVQRLAPAGDCAARSIGIVVGVGLFLIARAAGPG